jgi:hypothetical protein
MTIMYNRSRIWVSRPRNTEFRPVFGTYLCFLGKLKVLVLDFEPKFDFLKPVKFYIYDHYV